MNHLLRYGFLMFVSVSIFNLSCQKDSIQPNQKDKLKQLQDEDLAAKAAKCKPHEPSFDLDVRLSGNGRGSGFIKFRQDPDEAKIVTLTTSLKHLLPNHEYILQRAVDVTIDGNCTGTNWLTLGKGLTPQTILTDAKGNGEEELWRDLSAVASGTVFDIHFQILDASSLEIVLTSDCHAYIVR